jgi:hypothetical protein
MIDQRESVLSGRAKRLLAMIRDPHSWIHEDGEWMALGRVTNVGRRTFAELVNAGIIEEKYPDHRNRTYGSYFYRLKPSIESFPYAEDFGDLWIAD